MGRGKSIRGGYKGGNNAAASSLSSSRRPVGKKPPLTHFLCLPLVTETTRPQLQESLARFQEALLKQNDDIHDGSGNGAGVVSELLSSKAVRPLGTIHFTLGVMSLMDVDKVSEAVAYLQTIDIQNLMKQVVDEQRNLQNNSGPPRELFKISLTSLHSMHPPKGTSILYASPDDPANVLNTFCIKLKHVFTEAGFLIPDERPLKLHATVLNTIYAKAGGRQRQHGSSSLGNNATTAEAIPDRSQGHGPNAKAPIRIDATDLLEQCKDYVWASDFAIEKIAICRMGAKKILDEEENVVDEQYEEVAAVSFPKD